MVALAASWVLFFVAVSLSIAHDAQSYPPYGRIAFVTIIMALSSVLFFSWGRRWYMCRSYFTEPPAG